MGGTVPPICELVLFSERKPAILFQSDKRDQSEIAPRHLKTSVTGVPVNGRLVSRVAVIPVKRVAMAGL